jgi:xylitol oxidase
VADTSGVLLSTEHLNRIVALGERTVVVEAGIRYGELGRELARHGLGLSNYASLPHISVGGAAATATHGSGARNRSLASSVAALDLVCADGSLLHLDRTDDRFDGVVVALGALGLVVRVTLDVVSEFELCQQVFEGLAWPTVEANLDELLALGYSTSLFTRWTAAGVDQVWVKSTVPIESCFGAIPADGSRHPIAGADPIHTTEQLGVPGPSAERLPHFRLGFTPSGGDELQSEYAVAHQHAVDALRALRALGSILTPLLLTSELRAVAADSLWLSPFHERDSVCIHFTWKPLAAKVQAVLPRVEAALAPFKPRPHWGKLFAQSPAPLYPRLPEFRALRLSLDPQRVHANAFDSQLGI